MGFVELLLLSVGLGMDAFAVSVCKGISMKKMNWKKACIIGLYFGGFQALMPVLGYLIKDAFSKECDSFDDDVSFKAMIVLAIATSIDALAVGITFAFLKVNLILAISMIGVITFILAIVGTKVGNRFGDKYEKKAELVGGVILILLGIKILLEHIGILNF